MARLSVPWVEIAQRVKRFRLTGRESLALSVALVIALSYPAWRALVPAGWFLMIDDVAAIMILQMDKCFQDGQLPCRWTPDLAYGYGGPFLLHHAPLPSYVGQLLHMTGLSILDSARYTFILGFLIAGLSMFLLAREFWGNVGGVVSAIFYVYAPFLAMDVFVRGAQREQWGIALLPLVFWGIYKVLKEGARPRATWRYWKDLSPYRTSRRGQPACPLSRKQLRLRASALPSSTFLTGGSGWMVRWSSTITIIRLGSLPLLSRRASTRSFSNSRTPGYGRSPTICQWQHGVSS